MIVDLYAQEVVLQFSNAPDKPIGTVARVWFANEKWERWDLGPSYKALAQGLGLQPNVWVRSRSGDVPQEP